MADLIKRLEKLEAALSDFPKDRLCLFCFYDDTRVIDGEGKEYGSLEEAKRLNPEARDIFRVNNKEQIETVKEIHRNADKV